MAPAETMDRRYRKQWILSDAFGDFVGRDIRIGNHCDLLACPPEGRTIILAEGVERPFQRARLTRPCPGVKKEALRGGGIQASPD